MGDHVFLERKGPRPIIPVEKKVKE